MNTSFIIGRDGKLMENVVLLGVDGKVWFEEVFNMPFNELVNYEHIEDLVVACLDATNEAFNDGDQDTVVTLVDDDTGMFIWSIVIFPESDDEIRYEFHDWLADDDKRFRYADES